LTHFHPLPVDLQARDAFFAYYVDGSSKYWSFLKKYYHPLDSPFHLTLAIEAISLAYLWHQTYSDAALVTARQRYTSALHMTNKALGSPNEASKYTTLLAALLLDLFEKITDGEPRNNKSFKCHVDGALALVKFRGLEHFQGDSEFAILARVCTHCIVSYVASNSPVPHDLGRVLTYVEKRRGDQDIRWRLSGIMGRYATLCSNIKNDVLSYEKCNQISWELDGELQALDLSMPPSWQYSTKFLDHLSKRTLDPYLHYYPHRNTCQARNFLRIFRILVNEMLIEYQPASTLGSDHGNLMQVALNNIKALGREICASVPQYVDCDNAARWRLSTLSKPDCLDRNLDRHHHSHTLDQQFNCYILIVPLYVVGRSDAGPHIKAWVISQLHYISSHFYIRNAEIVAQMLEDGAKVDPWEVYAMLGCYAFPG
jgi:hypothetical protein